MITITPFEGEFCGEIRTIFSINNREPLKAYSHVTTSEMCPYCGKRSIFRMYECKESVETDILYKDIYDCRCPNCNKLFDITIEDTVE